MKYFVWGYYGYGNLGDELMLKVILDEIRIHDASAEIAVKYPDERQQAGFRAVNIDKGIISAKKTLGLSIFGAISSLVSTLNNSDCLVIGGGTIFIDKARRNWALFILSQAVSIARFLGKKVFVIGFGFDTLGHPSSKNYASNILRNANFVCPRDEFTYNECKKIGVDDSRLVLGSDLLYSINLEKSKKVKKRVVFSVIDYFGRLDSNPEKRQNLLKSLSGVAKVLIGQGYEVFFVSMQRNIGEKDFEFCEQILSETPGCSHVFLDSLPKAIEIFSSASFVFGMRFHALIFASCFKIPFLGVSHEKKLFQICSEFSMPIISMEDLISSNINIVEIIKNTRFTGEAVLARNKKLSRNNFLFLQNAGHFVGNNGKIKNFGPEV